LGPAHRHWRRARFLGRFRLFYRFSTVQKAIVYVWVNDETTLRKAGARTDPYAIFNKRLRDGDPPEDWDGLFLKAATRSAALRRRFGPDPMTRAGLQFTAPASAAA
jgi:toxin YhaV